VVVSFVRLLGYVASLSSVQVVRSLETPILPSKLEGLVMGTRSGDLDPAIHAHLFRQLGWSLDEIDRALNRDSGLKGLSGHNDFRELERLRQAGDERARLAFDVYCYRIKKYVGAYYAVLVVPTDEEWEIARQTLAVVDG
jgi:acetate kinase